MLADPAPVLMLYLLEHFSAEYEVCRLTAKLSYFLIS
jgi:hypothetical protein